METIILAGGLGKRLSSVIDKVPKTMSPINGKPFLEITLDYLEKNGVKNVILAVGYKKEYIKKYFGNRYKNIELIYSEEEKPLGTGGAIKEALRKCKGENIFVINGDVYVSVDISKMLQNHLKDNNDITIAIKKVKSTDRFGVVEIENNKVISFKEKKSENNANINVGCYIIKKELFKNKINMDCFSFEKEYLEKYVNIDKMGFYEYNGEFIDIGTPEDYIKMKSVL